MFKHVRWATGTRTWELRALKLKNNLQIEFETLRWKRNRVHMHSTSLQNLQFISPCVLVTS